MYPLNAKISTTRSPQSEALSCMRCFQILSLGMKSQSVSIQMKATKQHFFVELFIRLHKVVQTFESVDEIVKCDHSNHSY